MIKTRKQTAECPALHDSAAGLDSEPDGTIPYPHHLYYKVLFNIIFMSKNGPFFMFSTISHLMFPMYTACFFHLVLLY
jgi:hypothetical protein